MQDWTKSLEPISPAKDLILEMVATGGYRAILWAGNYEGYRPHSFSDIDLYAVSASNLKCHWYMERLNSRKRIELTVYTLPKWQEILSAQYHHAMHHFTFSQGQVLYDPDKIVPSLRNTADEVLKTWKGSETLIGELRKTSQSVRISSGVISRKMKSHKFISTRFHWCVPFVNFWFITMTDTH